MSGPVAIDLKDPSSFPSRRTEAWKYSDLRRWLRDAPSPVADASGDAPEPPVGDLGGDEILFVDGRRAGFDGLVVEGRRMVRLRFVSTQAGAGHQARVTLDVRPGAELVLIETHEGPASGAVAVVSLDIDVGKGAHLTRIVVAEGAADAIQIVQAEIRLASGARLAQTTLAAGSRLQRIETHVAHPGAGAEVRLDGAYVLKAERHSDQTSVVTHGGPDGRTSQLIKGVVTDTARGVFQGKIVVERGADGTDARMGHHGLILSDRGEIDAKPELIIYADEVQCAHGNTVGNLDEQALFYMQQRGIGRQEARALLTQAFLMEVVDRIEHEPAREAVRSWLTARL